MRRFLTSGAIILGVLFIIFQSRVVDAFLMFLIVGAIPSSAYTISPLAMIVLSVVAAWALLVFASHVISTAKFDQAAYKKSRESAKKSDSTANEPSVVLPTRRQTLPRRRRYSEPATSSS